MRAAATPRSTARAVLRAAVLATLLPAPLAAQHAHQPAAIAGLGSVHFATSCRREVAPTFDRAIALLHSFEFAAAIRGFEEVIAADSACAMAHWGVALSRWSNPMAVNVRPPSLLARARTASDAAKRFAAAATERERRYADAVAKLYDGHETLGQPARLAAYEAAMADLVAKHPDDSEAKIFHALAMVAAAPPTDKSYARQKQAGALLEALWKEQPNHPGLAHYIIHSYDYPPLAPQAAAAARRYAEIAPAATHALHMPSHTFTRLGDWEASVASNRRSAESALRDSSLAELLHAYDYQVYAYLQLRRDSAAKTVLARLPAIAAHFDPAKVTGAAPGWAGIFALAAMPARYALERRAWAEAASLPAASTAWPFADAMTWFARALGAARTGRTSEARASVDTLGAIAQRLSTAGEPYWAEQVAIQRLGAQGWLALAEGRKEDALAHLREAATREDATEKSAVTPGPLAPAREQLGDLLLELGRPAEALAEYRRTMTKEPNRFLGLEGARRAALAAGDRKAAASYAAEIRKLTGS